jgi:hypothetical protein
MFDFQIEFLVELRRGGADAKPESAPETSGVPIFTALQQQLGLKLEMGQSPGPRAGNRSRRKVDAELKHRLRPKVRSTQRNIHLIVVRQKTAALIPRALGTRQPKTPLFSSLGVSATPLDGAHAQLGVLRVHDRNLE